MVRRHIIIKCMAAAALFVLMAISLVGSRTVAGPQFSQGQLVEVPVLNYHMVDNLAIPLSISPEQFDEQMKYLSENGYHSITPDQLLDYLEYGRRLPENAVLITFDDGYLDNYTKAYPILKKYGFTATIFVVTGLVGNDPRFLTWNQIREMRQNGFVFGSHTANHVPITQLGPEQAQKELTESSMVMENQLGTKPAYFAYPTGAYNRQAEQLVRRVGYRAAFTIRYGRAGMESDHFAIERIPIFRSTKTFRSFYYRLTAAPILERLGIIRN
ncbi:MAG: polysaccharide deacetylase [Firmicutes bacterium]|nr:polysaccharide deacetylase [Bacillota bacterium]